MIDYKILTNSIDHYELFGYKRIESPWLISEAINRITAPPEASMYYVSKKNKVKTFVASGEQSFLYLINKGFLTPGSYQTITPCIRDDDFDSTHTKYFMKNELIRFDNVNETNLRHVVHNALEFFVEYIPEHYLDVEKTGSQSFDINMKINDRKIELGSYGIRECDFTKWIYGTGVAEPRFSTALNILKKELQ